MRPLSPSRSAAALLLLVPLSACSGGAGRASGARAGAPRGAAVAEAAEDARTEAEKRADRVTTTSDRSVPIEQLSDEDRDEFRRAWRLFVDHDPRWARARGDWLARGGAAPYLLAENLFRYFWSANSLLKNDEIARVGREAAFVGEPAVGYFADLLVLERWPLREATVTTVFNPDNATKPLQGTVTHLGIDDVSRQNAARVLAAIGAPSVPTLASPRVLRAANASSRTYAVYALGRIGTDDAIRALAGVLRTATEWTERGAAAKALGFALQRAPAARAPLQEALNDPDPFVRKKAQEGLDGKSTLEF